MVYDDYAAKMISEKEWNLLHALSDFTGFFNHLFEFNNFSYFDDLQEELEKNGGNFKDIFLYDIIALELFRRQLGFHDFTGLEKLSNFISAHPLVGIVHDPFFFPTAAEISYVLNLVPFRENN